MKPSLGLYLIHASVRDTRPSQHRSYGSLNTGPRKSVGLRKQSGIFRPTPDRGGAPIPGTQ